MAAVTTTTEIAPPPPSAYRSPEAASSLAEVLDRILHVGVSLEGNLTIGLANVDLLYLDVRLLLAAVDTVWPEGRPPFSAAPTPDQAPPLPRPPPAPAPELRSRPIPPAGVEPSAIGAGGVTPLGSPVSPPAPVAGLVRLVLTLVKLLHELLERLAIRRMDGGQLTAPQIEDVGAALLAQAVEIERLRTHFGFADRDLALRFGLFDRSIRG